MIREMFRSEAINDFNSARLSSLIRPMSVRTVSPFALRRILNTYRRMQSSSQCPRMKRGHLCGWLMASSRQMSENRQITTPIRSRLLMQGLQLRTRVDGEGGRNLHRKREPRPYRSSLTSLSYAEMDLATVPEAPPTTNKISHYLLAGAHFGEGTEGRGVMFMLMLGAF
jgi:hypothetical protein